MISDQKSNKLEKMAKVPDEDMWPSPFSSRASPAFKLEIPKKLTKSEKKKQRKERIKNLNDDEVKNVNEVLSVKNNSLRPSPSSSGEKEEAKMTTIDDLKVDEVDYLMKFLTAEDVMALGTDLCQVARHLPTRVEKEETQGDVRCQVQGRPHPQGGGGQ